MNWFKKSIGYDQKRKLQFLPILIILPIIQSVMSSISVMKVDEFLSRYNVFSIGVGKLSYVAVLGVAALIAIISSGIRDKSEVSYMESMPMKIHDVTITRLTCASIVAIIPLGVGFLISTLVYIGNKDFLQKEGYLYLDIVYKYGLMILMALTIIGLVYLASVLYKNIKIPIVLGIGGIASLGYIASLFAQCLKDGNPIKQKIYFFIQSAVEIVILPMSDKIVFYPITTGTIIALLGVVILLFILIDYVTSSVNNDVYDKLFSFKVSKGIYYVLSVLIIIFIFGIALEAIIQFVYISPISRGMNYEDQVLTKIYNEKVLFVDRVQFVVVVLLLPLWIFISKKIGTVLEERF